MPTPGFAELTECTTYRFKASLFAYNAALGCLLALVLATAGCSSISSAPASGSPNGSQQNNGSAPNPAAPTVSPSQAVVASGGQLQFTATVSNSADTGVIWKASAGTITTSGMFTAPKVSSTTQVTVTASRTSDPTKSGTVAVTVQAKAVPAKLVIGTTSLPAATTGSVYAADLSAAGGLAPYSWKLASGTPPAGLTLSSGGALTGTPSRSGSFTFVASVSDSSNQQATQTYSLTVAGNTGTGNAGGFDGPAELPQVYVQSALADTPAPGATIAVAAGGDFQSALNSAQCGDTITLQAGATFSGNFLVPAKNCDAAHWIIIRTSAADSALPPEGTRITPCFAGVASLPGRPSFACSSTKNVMAKIVYAGFGSQPLQLASGINYVRFLGLEITRTSPGNVIYDLVSLQNSGPADHLIFDRVWIHGTAQDETTRGLALGGSTYVGVVDSFFSDFHCVAISGACGDSQAIDGGLGDLPMGPYKIVDNYLEAAGENLMFGGGPATQTPQDIEIRLNYFFKPLMWMRGRPGFVGGTSGNPFIVKNHLEFKNAVRVLFEGNVLQNAWGGFSQIGYSILLTPKNQNGHCAVCVVHDITIRYSTISHVGGGIVMGNGRSDSGALPIGAWNESIHDLVIDDVSATAYNGGGYFFEEVNGNPLSALHDVAVNHVTAVGTDVSAMLVSGNDLTNPPMSHFSWTNNILATGIGVISTGGGSENCAYHAGGPGGILTSCYSPYVFRQNALIAPTGKWPTGNFAPATIGTVHFVDYNNGSGGNYQLQSNSPYKNAGSDGTDLGADTSALNSLIAGVAP
jgi:hypothetical protein